MKNHEKIKKLAKRSKIMNFIQKTHKIDQNWPFGASFQNPQNQAKSPPNPLKTR